MTVVTDLQMIEQAWDGAARQDAMFNIITDPSKKDGGWDADEFFGHGETEIGAAVDRLVEFGLGGRAIGRALDFGCGIGRVTQALAAYAEHVDGVDVSEEMVRRAREHEAWGDVTYLHNPSPDLRVFPDDTFDLVYSMVTLQHMPHHLQRGYIREFFRVLAPRGVVMVHIPDGPDSGSPGWHHSMHGVPRDTVRKWIADAGGYVVDVQDLGVDASWRNLRYTAVVES